MNYYRSLVKKSRLYPVLLLEQIFPALSRHLFLQIIAVVVVVLIGLSLPTQASGLVVGLLLLTLALFLALWALELFFRSYYYESIITNEYGAEDIFTFTVGRILFQVRDNRALEAFLTSKIGEEVIRRLGIHQTIVDQFLEKEYQPTVEIFSFDSREVLRLKAMVTWLWQNHESWQRWLAKNNLQQTDLLATVDWVIRDLETEAQKKRWWSRENLERVPGLAEDWAYGGTYTLDRYSQDLTSTVVADATAGSARSQEVISLETVLSRSREANALLVGSDAEALRNTLWQFARVIKSGTTLPTLRKKRLLLFSVANFLATFSDRQGFELELGKALNEAVRAGNIILAVDNLASLLGGGEGLGSDVVAILEPYLAANQLQIIGFVEIDAYQRLLGTHQALMPRFEKVDITEVGEERIMTLLEDLSKKLEKVNKIKIIYPALREVYQNAEQYFQAESIADKAMDLLVEAVPWVLGHGRNLIDRSVIQELTKEKTSIPLGKIDQAEQQKLLGLEAALHTRVIGQEAALKAVAGAMRRGRTGIRNLKRPMGSFLFLGPTGVGKTETAKALAATFFGREDALLRLDMSEYQTGDALERLIGSFGSGQPGVLASLIRENPYGALLLDEFEKTNTKVLNLFLQILDEGFFSDMMGKRVNARNLIFIATSNAGAKLLWQMVKSGRDPVVDKDEIVNTLISQAIYRPELLNRFDEIVVFHPLSENNLQAVARLLLKKLAVRLLNQGITLIITDDLVDVVVREGSNELFGARPMQRLIQDRVEQGLAEAMIRGEVKSGSRISFSDHLKLTVE